MFAAKYGTNSVAKIFALAGHDLGRPIKSESAKSTIRVIGQTEERIYEYLQSIGISKRKAIVAKAVGIPFSRYNEIPAPDLAPLAKSFSPTFAGTFADIPNRKDANPLRAMD